MVERIKRGINLLMVDNAPSDVFSVQRALEQSGVGESFYAVSSVQDAIDYLKGVGRFLNRGEFPFPNVLLLDLRLPVLSGFEMLKWLRGHIECRVIPVIVYAASTADDDIRQAYVLGANAYLVKPMPSEELVATIKITYDFWSRCQTPMPPPGEKCA